MQRAPAIHSDELVALGDVTEKRRRDFTIGRYCAHRALRLQGDSSQPLLIGAHGEPMWPPGIVGSITHCPGYCAAAVAKRRDIAAIGIDVELNCDIPKDEVDLIALGCERRWLDAMPRANISWSSVLFSAKESVYKAWFPLMRTWLGFEDVAIRVAPEAGRFFAQFSDRVPALHGHGIIGGHFNCNGNLIATTTIIDSPPAVSSVR